MFASRVGRLRHIRVNSGRCQRETHVGHTVNHSNVKETELRVDLTKFTVFIQEAAPRMLRGDGRCYPSHVTETLGLLDSHSLQYGYKLDMHL